MLTPQRMRTTALPANVGSRNHNHHKYTKFIHAQNKFGRRQRQECFQCDCSVEYTFARMPLLFDESTTATLLFDFLHRSSALSSTLFFYMLIFLFFLFLCACFFSFFTSKLHSVAMRPRAPLMPQQHQTHKSFFVFVFFHSRNLCAIYCNPAQE